jgi:hypothetical protein
MVSRARWSDQEWNNVCLQLYRRQPLATMTNIGLLKKEDVITAMKEVLPEPRWHRTMNMTLLRPKLKERLHSLKEELQSIEQTQKAEQARVEELERAQIKTRQRVDVFSPLIDVMAERLYQRLMPMFDEYLSHRLNGAPPTDALHAGIAVHKTEKVHKIKIGVVGLIPIQEQEVLKKFSEFPFLELHFFDKDRGTKGFRVWAHGLDTVFLLTSKINHGYESMLSHYTRVPGRGTSSMIRSIEVWLASRK